MNSFQKFSEEPLIAAVDVPNEPPYGAALESSIMSVNSKHQKKVNDLLGNAESAQEKAKGLLLNGTMTYRDLYLLETMLGVGILTSSQIHQLFWFAQTRNALRKRLGKLEKLGLLESSSGYWHTLKSLKLPAENVYKLATFGKVLLAVYGGRVSAKQIPYDDQYYNLVIQNRLFKHHIMTSQIYTRFKVASRYVGNQMKWVNEMSTVIRMESSGQELVRPDGFFKIYREDIAGSVLGFVETDTRNTEWEKKIASYEKAMMKGDWAYSLGKKFPVVFCVVPNDRAVLRIGKLIQEQHNEVKYLVKSWQKFNAEDLFEAWYIPHQAKFSGRWLPDMLDNRETEHVA